MYKFRLGSVYQVPRPVAVPFSWREFYFIGIQFIWKFRRCNKQIWSEEKLAWSIKVQWMRVGGCIWKFEKERTHYRQPSSRHLFDCSIEVWHQAVALFDVMTTYRLLLGTMHPRFLRRGTFFGVITINGLEGGNLHPFS